LEESGKAVMIRYVTAKSFITQAARVTLSIFLIFVILLQQRQEIDKRIF
jgi:hypothetical protein